jgi:hypothetical protein
MQILSLQILDLYFTRSNADSIRSAKALIDNFVADLNGAKIKFILSIHLTGIAVGSKPVHILEDLVLRRPEKQDFEKPELDLGTLVHRNFPSAIAEIISFGDIRNVPSVEPEKYCSIFKLYGVGPITYLSYELYSTTSIRLHLPKAYGPPVFGNKGIKYLIVTADSEYKINIFFKDLEIKIHNLISKNSDYNFLQIAFDRYNEALLDNGTLGNTNGNGTGQYFDQLAGGDGLSVGYGKAINGNTYLYTSYQAGVINRKNVASFNLETITPSNSFGTTLWHTLFKLDNDNTEFVYFHRNYRLWRNTSASTATTENWTEMTGVNSIIPEFTWISALTTTRGSYNPSTSSLFIGLDNGKLFRLDDPANAGPLTVPVDINAPPFNDWGYISSIAVNPRNDDTVLVTRSSYNVISIWWTGNANSASPTWVNVERNLSLPSVRSSAIAVTATGVEYFAGTSVGLFHSANPLTNDWTQESPEGVGNAVVTSLALRTSDNSLLAGTYGNGLWSTTLSSPALPLTLLDFKGKLQHDNVLLKWKTVNESNTSGFEIQRSYDGVNFVAVGFVPAAGNSSTTLNYQFLDREPAASKNYYRLKMIDLDTRYTTSEIIYVKKEVPAQKIYVSNPFRDQIDLRFSRISRKVEISLFDMSGRLLGKEQVSNSMRASLTFNNAVQSLSNGVYILEIKAGEERFTFKLTKE